MSRVEFWRHFVEIVALIVAAVWGAYVFVYQERIKPETSPPRLQVDLKVDRTTLPGERKFVNVRMLLKNTGESTVMLDGLIINVEGFRYEARQRSVTEHPVSGIIRTGTALQPGPPTTIVSFVNEWHPFGTEKYAGISPSNTFVEGVDVAVPAHRYDAVRVRWVACFSHPTERRFNIKRVKRSSGAYEYEDLPYLTGDKSGEFACAAQRRGEIYPLVNAVPLPPGDAPIP